MNLFTEMKRINNSHARDLATADGLIRYRRALGTLTTVTYAVELPRLGIVKIGRTKNIRARMKQLQAVSPYPVRLIGMIRGDIEVEVLSRFSRYRIRGEWFRNTVAIRRYFRRPQ